MFFSCIVVIVTLCVSILHSCLIKRLKQFEVLGEVGCSRPAQVLDTVSDQDNENALLATAIRIRAELDAELEYAKVAGGDGSGADSDSKWNPGNPNNPGYDCHGYSNLNSMDEPYCFKSPGSASSQNPPSRIPQQSPLATVTATPSNVIQDSIPTLGTGSNLSDSPKTKKGSKNTKAPLSTPDKQKPHGRMNATVKKKKADADPNAPKKPSNAFFWFCQEKRASLQEQFRAEGMSGQHDLTKALAKHWSETNSEDKKVSVCVEWRVYLSMTSSSSVMIKKMVAFSLY